jgi:myo-inositol-1(or 4)-monophosphatase
MTLPHFGNIASTRKSVVASDVVTEIDIHVEKYLHEKLDEMHPEIPFVGEETGGDGTVKKFWLCDPIDGTGDFVRGLPFCTTMLCLIDDGLVVFSCIYNFVTDEMYHALRGGGAFKNGKPIRVSERKDIGIYIGYETKEREPHLLAIRTKVLLKKYALLKTFNAGWELCMVAEGKIEGRVQVEPYGKTYDFAPGSLLVDEAGGIVRNLGSMTYDYRNTNFIAGNEALIKDLTEGEEAIFPVKI